MATKSIIDIDVNDSSFQRFAAMFAKYQAQLQNTPAAWQAVASNVTAATAGIKNVAATTAAVGAQANTQAAAFNNVTAQAVNQTVQQGNQIRLIVNGQSQIARSAKTQASYWHDLSKSSRSFAGHITDATRSLLRWASLTGVIGGLLGAGGLFGIDRLAASAGGQRRSALGLGISSGEQQAFNLNYGRVVDAPAFLGQTNDMMHDITQQWKLRSEGLSEGDTTGKDAAEVSVMRINALKKMVDGVNNPAIMRQILDSHGFKDVDTETATRIKNTPASELAEYYKGYQKDKRNGLNDSELRLWQNLDVQLRRAGITLENTFIKGLTALAGPIGNLSAAFTKAVGDLLSAPQLRDWINDLAHGVKWFADYMQTPAFKANVEAFVKDVGELGTAIGDAFTAIIAWVKWFKGTNLADGAKDAIKNGGVNGPLTDDNPRAPGSPAFRAQREAEGKPVGKPLGTDGTYDFSHRGDDFGWMSRYWNWMKDRWYNGPEDSGDIHKQAYHTWGGRSPYVSEAAYRPMAGAPSAFTGNLPSGVTPGLLDAVEHVESGGRDLTSSAGAQGYFQFMPATAARYGVNVHDEQSSRAGAAAYLSDLRRDFGGDMAKALASYNWGEGNVQKDVARYGDKWRDHLPQETANYLNRVAAAQSRGGGNRNVTISVHNNTGGNAVVSTSQLVI